MKGMHLLGRHGSGDGVSNPCPSGSPATPRVWKGPDRQVSFSQTNLFRDLRESETFSVLLVSLPCMFSVPGPREQ